MTKYKISTITFNDGHTEYGIMRKDFLFWMNVHEISFGEDIGVAKFETLKEAEETLSRINARAIKNIK